MNVHMTKAASATTGVKYSASEYWPIDKLKLWDKNPRSIKGERFEELKTRLQRQGQIKPLLVTKDGTVIGGNMRLRAMQALGVKEVWVSVQDISTDKEIFDLALTDNEEFGYYEKEQVAELALELGLSPVELGSYELQLGQGTTLDAIMQELSPEGLSDEFDLDDSDKPGFGQMTFMLADEQMDVVKAAIAKARALDGPTYENENGNGNALYWMADSWLNQ